MCIKFLYIPQLPPTICIFVHLGIIDDFLSLWWKQRAHLLYICMYVCSMYVCMQTRGLLFGGEAYVHGTRGMYVSIYVWSWINRSNFVCLLWDCYTSMCMCQCTCLYVLWACALLLFVTENCERILSPRHSIVFEYIFVVSRRFSLARVAGSAWPAKRRELCCCSVDFCSFFGTEFCSVRHSCDFLLWSITSVLFCDFFNRAVQRSCNFLWSEAYLRCDVILCVVFLHFFRPFCKYKKKIWISDFKVWQQEVWNFAPSQTCFEGEKNRISTLKIWHLEHLFCLITDLLFRHQCGKCVCKLGKKVTILVWFMISQWRHGVFYFSNVSERKVNNHFYPLSQCPRTVTVGGSETSRLWQLIRCQTDYGMH